MDVVMPVLDGLSALEEVKKLILMQKSLYVQRKAMKI